MFPVGIKQREESKCQITFDWSIAQHFSIYIIRLFKLALFFILAASDAETPFIFIQLEFRICGLLSKAIPSLTAAYLTLMKGLQYHLDRCLLFHSCILFHSLHTNWIFSLWNIHLPVTLVNVKDFNWHVFFINIFFLNIHRQFWRNQCQNDFASHL